MKLGKDGFYLYDQYGKKMIYVKYCNECGNKYFFEGVEKTIFETIKDRRTAKEILEFKGVHNLMYEKELGTQKSIFDYTE